MQGHCFSTSRQIFFRPCWYELLQGMLQRARMLWILYFQGKGQARNVKSVWALKNKNKHFMKSSLHLEGCNTHTKKRSLLKNLVDPSFVNLMRAEITSDDSIIRHHYQHQNVFGAVWPGADGSLCKGMIWITLCKPTLPPSHFLCLSVKHSDDRRCRIKPKYPSDD